MGEVIYGAFASRTKHTGGIRSPKQRTLLNADLLWRHKGWAYQPPSTNFSARWEKEIAGVDVWAYIIELKRRYGHYAFERRSDAHSRRWKGELLNSSQPGTVHPLRVVASNPSAV